MSPYRKEMTKKMVEAEKKAAITLAQKFVAMGMSIPGLSSNEIGELIAKFWKEELDNLNDRELCSVYNASFIGDDWKGKKLYWALASAMTGRIIAERERRIGC